jgi:hypothetical protein
MQPDKLQGSSDALMGSESNPAILPSCLGPGAADVHLLDTSADAHKGYPWWRPPESATLSATRRCRSEPLERSQSKTGSHEYPWKNPLDDANSVL